MHKSGIYAIYSPSGARYVGSAVNLTRRWYLHLRSLRRGDHHCAGLARAAAKYGIDNLRFEVLEYRAPADLVLREQIYIDATPARKRYNSSPTAGNTLGVKHSAQARANMPAAQLGNKRSEEVRAKISAYQRSKPPVSEETRAKMRAAQLGKKRPGPHKPRPAELRAKMAACRSAATNTSGFHGVHFHKGAKKWMARAKDKYLGLFATPDLAAQARSRYLAELSCNIASDTQETGQ